MEDFSDLNEDLVVCQENGVVQINKGKRLHKDGLPAGGD